MKNTPLLSSILDVTGVSVAHAACRCREPGRGRPPVLTVDFESDLSLFPSSELFIYFIVCVCVGARARARACFSASGAHVKWSVTNLNN